MARIFVHRVKNHPYKVLLFRDSSGKRRQKSMGRMSEEEARTLREQGGRMVSEAEARALLRKAERPPVGREENLTYESTAEGRRRLEEQNQMINQMALERFRRYQAEKR